MNEQHFRLILSTYDLDQIVKFVNDNTDPYCGLDMPKIYNMDDSDEQDDFLHDLVKWHDYDFVKKTLNDIKDTDKYVCCCEGQLLIFNDLHDILDVFSIDNLYEWVKEWEYEDIEWED